MVISCLQTPKRSLALEALCFVSCGAYVVRDIFQVLGFPTAFALRQQLSFCNEKWECQGNLRSYAY